MTTLLRIAAAAIAVLILNTAADARQRHYRQAVQQQASNTTQFCGDRVCGVSAPEAVRHERRVRHASKRGHRKASLAMRIDKHQEYVKPSSPDEKLVTREAHEIASGIVRSKKTGATARVSPRYAHKFQAYIDDLEKNYGAKIYYMGGYRRGHCSNGSQHPCGMALDVCQDARDVVSRDRNCNLPDRVAMIAVANRHGLEEGGQWCHGDRGHVQAQKSAGPCGNKLYAAVVKFKKDDLTRTYQP